MNHVQNKSVDTPTIISVIFLSFKDGGKKEEDGVIKATEGDMKAGGWG